jgi:hypothetical protein
MRWSEAGYLSRIVLTHAPRQVSVSLILGVRPKRTNHVRHDTFKRWFLATLTIANAVAFVPAYHDRSWGALFTGIVANPIMNLIFLVAGVIIGFRSSRNVAGFTWKRHLMIAVVGPIIACVILFSSIIALDLHGC